MSITDQCFQMIIRNDVVIDDELREKIVDHVKGIFTNEERFGEDAFPEDEPLPIQVYLGLVWKKRKAACLSITTRAKDKLEKINNILEQIDDDDLEIDDDISLKKPERIEQCDFERYKKKKGDVLWETLEHNGPYFKHIFEPYQSLGLTIKYDGKEYDLEPEEEEVLRFWANRIITESNPQNKKKFIDKKEFKDNYFSTLKPYLTPEHRKTWTNFNKFDFSDMVDRILELKDEQKEDKKSRSVEEKLRDKIDNLERKLNYNYAFVNGIKKELKSYAVEVQGIYVGAGNVMTHKGKIKKRIMPEDVIINVGKGAAPDPPKGHKWKGVVNEPTKGWTASYKDEITGQNKYVRLKESGDLLKFEKARKLNKYIDVIDKRIQEKLNKENGIDRQIGTVVYLIKNFGFRVGTEEGEDDDKGEKVVGATTLEVRNIKPKDGNRISLKFFGKDSQLYENTLEVDKGIYDNIVDFTKGKKPSEQLFDKIGASDVNNFLKSIDRDFTAKVFRTRLASNTMYEGLQEYLNYKKNATDDEKVADFNKVNKDVAIRLNHKKGITDANKASIIKDKEKITTLETKLEEEEAKLENLEGDEKIKKQKEKIKNLKSNIKDKKIKLKDKKENLGIALETSKKNYIDPRVVKSWTETVEVPITKIYSSKELQKHFAWAIEDEEINDEFDYLETPLDCIVGDELVPKLDEPIRRPDKPKVEKVVKPKVSPKEVKPFDKPVRKGTKVRVSQKPFIIDYSPRTIAVIGDTFRFKEELKKMGGTFNKFLTHEEKKVPGWLFLKIQKDKVQQWLDKIVFIEEEEDEIKKIDNFCKDISQENFAKLLDTTRQEFKNFATLVIQTNNGNIAMANAILKLQD